VTSVAARSSPDGFALTYSLRVTDGQRLSADYLSEENPCLLMLLWSHYEALLLYEIGLVRL
jgi:hypothetical protein